MKISIQFRQVLVEKLVKSVHDTTKNRMVAQALFDFKDGDATYTDALVKVSRPYGTLDDQTEIEVGQFEHDKYDGPWNHNQFAEYVEKYYRFILGSGPKGNIDMGNDQFIVNVPPVAMEVSDEAGGW